LSGTPALVVGNEVVAGAVSKDALNDLITKARTKS
jgi:protein-disulfide isomerase